MKQNIALLGHAGKIFGNDGRLAISKKLMTSNRLCYVSCANPLSIKRKGFAESKPGIFGNYRERFYFQFFGKNSNATQVFYQVQVSCLIIPSDIPLYMTQRQIQRCSGLTVDSDSADGWHLVLAHRTSTLVGPRRNFRLDGAGKGWSIQQIIGVESGCWNFSGSPRICA